MSDPNLFGDHTDKKLSIIGRYLQSYTTALSGKNFSLIYVDAFAGTGKRKSKSNDEPSLISEFVEMTRKGSKPGSATIALETQPGFDVLLFVELEKKRFQALSTLVDQYPDRNCMVRHGDANVSLKRLCSGLDWHGDEKGKQYRAVVFLDPFGMHVEWDTLEYISRTEAIDVWYLFPTHAVLRQAALDPSKLDKDKVGALDRILGGRWWRSEFYSMVDDGMEGIEDMFTGLPQLVIEKRTATAADVEAAFARRLNKLFSYVCPKPLRLFNQKVPMFSLFFAVSNPSPKACGIAGSIAEHIIRQANVEGIQTKRDLYNAGR